MFPYIGRNLVRREILKKRDTKHKLLICCIEEVENNVTRSNNLFNQFSGGCIEGHSLYGMTQKLNAANIHSVLLKGQGIAQDYVVPVTRQCGDLDIWVGNDVYQDVCDAIQKEGYSADYAMARADKHLNFTYEKCTIEIHRFQLNLIMLIRIKPFMLGLMNV